MKNKIKIKKNQKKREGYTKTAYSSLLLIGN